ncbi:MAG: FecR domain-containing protein [Pirellulales bacterium]|nr:FecR domain-containing protein [Pirellulales bacterium]
MNDHLTHDAADRDEFEQLAAALCDGQIDAAGIERLEQLATADPALTNRLLQVLNLDAHLRQSVRGTIDAKHVAEQAVDSEAKVEPSAVSGQRSAFSRVEIYRSSFINHRSSFIRRHNLAIGIAAGFAVVAAVIGWMAVSYLPNVAQEEDTPVEQEKATSNDFVARLIASRDAEWLEGTKLPANDPRLYPGTRLLIGSGLIEIKYLTGTRVVIEGPAEFIVGGKQTDEASGLEDEPASLHAAASNGGFLARGSLVARCDTPRSIGFTVTTPSARVVDLGTEFGVEVNEQGEANVAVLVGEVQLIVGKGNRPGQRLRLTRDQSAVVAADGIAKRRDGIDVRFVAAMRRRLDAISEPLVPQIEGVTIRDVSSELAGEQTMFERGAIHMIDGSGLLRRRHASGPADGNMWLTTGAFAQPLTTLPAYVVFDLGGDFALAELHVWNYNEGVKNLTSRGAKAVEIGVATSEEGTAFEKLVLADSTSAFVFPRAAGTPAYQGFHLDLRDTTNAQILKNVRYVRFDIKSSYGGNPEDKSSHEVVGLSEVMFFGTPTEMQPGSPAPAVDTETMNDGEQ